MSEELKPCPFCGVVDYNITTDDYKNETVNCWGCGAIGPYAETIEEAIEAWNRRAGNQQQEQNEEQEKTPNQETIDAMLEAREMMAKKK